MSDICEICLAPGPLTSSGVAPRDDTLAFCDTCLAAVQGDITPGPHWQCLNDAIWSENAAVKVTAYRLLHQLTSEVWVRDLLEIAYLEPETLAWAEAEMAEENDIIHRDSNSVVLAAGDTVVLIKDLPVKGAGFTAKRGTAVRNISLSPDNETHIEGRVNGQQIIILTQFVKKSG